MKNRGPIDFLAALIVEFGGLALLLAALTFLGGLGSGGPNDESSISLPQPAHLPPLPWPRASNPTPWDDQAVDRQPSNSDPAYVEHRLRPRGERLVQGILGGIERVFEDH